MADQTLRSGLMWSVLVPVKVLARAKSRLAGLADADRRTLVLAMAADTVAAAIGCPAVGAVVVVSDDPDVRAVVTAIGAHVTGDRPRSGLNFALLAGADYAHARWPAHGRAGLTADLPALSPGELAEALTSAGAAPESFVADAAGVGTTLYAARPGAAFRPRFGPGSADLHRRAGAAELHLPAESGLRQDVDTIEDLREAAERGLGRRSAAVVRSLNVGLSRRDTAKCARSGRSASA
jgi:2-phospho-L-lactate/phosphoenolpyruvate guanylyltransferase